MPPAEIEPAIPARERPQTHALSPRGFDYEGKIKAGVQSRKIEKIT
jgi:hypothetical protein